MDARKLLEKESWVNRGFRNRDREFHLRQYQEQNRERSRSPERYSFQSERELPRHLEKAPVERPQMETGVAYAWRGEKGFGFIKPDDGGDDLFCHYSNITDGNALQEGKRVTYVKSYDPKSGRVAATKLTGGVTEAYAEHGQKPLTEDKLQGKMTGTVSMWNPKGFGFVTPDEGGDDLFCHYTCISDGNILVLGTKVAYVKAAPREGNSKFRAEQVVGGVQQTRADREAQMATKGAGGKGGKGGKGLPPPYPSAYPPPYGMPPPYGAPQLPPPPYGGAYGAASAYGAAAYGDPAAYSAAAPPPPHGDAHLKDENGRYF